MRILEVILAVLLPPLAVVNRGCGAVVITFFFTLFGWVPGVICALLILFNDDNKPIIVVNNN